MDNDWKRIKSTIDFRELTLKKLMEDSIRVLTNINEDLPEKHFGKYRFYQGYLQAVSDIDQELRTIRAKRVNDDDNL